jgi:hypothetical protein
MNYLAHALPHLDRPYFMAGTGVPDWLSVVDRKVRLRTKHVEPFVNHSDAILSDVAGGVLDHLREDTRFHNTRAFAELSWQLTVLIRDAIKDNEGLRPNFLGHLLVEIMLDAALIAENPGGLHEYYRVLDTVDAGAVEAAVNRMAPKGTNRLAWMIDEYRRLRILWDYLDDERLMLRLNQIMGRVKLPLLSVGFCAVLPDIREIVKVRKNELLQSN